MQSGSPPARPARGLRVNRAGTTYTFAHDRWANMALAAIMVPSFALLCFILWITTGWPFGVPGKVGLIGIIAVSVLLACFRTARKGVRVSAGRVSIRNDWRTRTVNIEEIRGITLEEKTIGTGDGQHISWVPRIRLASGKEIWLTGMSCGPTYDPPVAWRLASLDKFRSLIEAGQAPTQADHAPLCGCRRGRRRQWPRRPRPGSR
jgi:hypothetical protein